MFLDQYTILSVIIKDYILLMSSAKKGTRAKAENLTLFNFQSRARNDRPMLSDNNFVILREKLYELIF